MPEITIRWRHLCHVILYELVQDTSCLQHVHIDELEDLISDIVEISKDRHNVESLSTIYSEWRFQIDGRERNITTSRPTISIQLFHKMLSIDFNCDENILNVMLAMLINEFNRSLMIRYTEVTVDWLCNVEEIFFLIDEPGYGYITRDELIPFMLILKEKELQTRKPNSTSMLVSDINDFINHMNTVICKHEGRDIIDREYMTLSNVKVYLLAQRYDVSALLKIRNKLEAILKKLYPPIDRLKPLFYSSRLWEDAAIRSLDRTKKHNITSLTNFLRVNMLTREIQDIIIHQDPKESCLMLCLKLKSLLFNPMTLKDYIQTIALTILMYREALDKVLNCISDTYLRGFRKKVKDNQGNEEILISQYVQNKLFEIPLHEDKTDVKIIRLNEQGFKILQSGSDKTKGIQIYNKLITSNEWIVPDYKHIQYMWLCRVESPLTLKSPIKSIKNKKTTRNVIPSATITLGRGKR